MKELTIEEKAQRYDAWLAWLEKQGEQKSIDSLTQQEAMDIAVAKCFEQGERKPAEWHREDEQNLNACLGYIPDEFLRRWLTDTIHVKYDKPTWSEEDELHIRELESLVKQVWATAEHENDKDTIHKMSDLSFFLKTLKPQPKQEWSEEDEKKIESIIETIRIRKFEHPQLTPVYEGDISWLKSLKDRVQPKQEWNEEDDYNLQCMIAKVVSDIQKGNIGRNNELIDWLKSLKDRVQPQPNQEWKQENTGELTDFENAMMYIGGSFFGQYAGLDPNDTNTIKKQANILLELVPSKEWSEEDKYNFSDIEAMIHTMRGDGRNADKLINWLRERIQPQTNITDEELAQAKKDAYNDALDKIEYRSGEPTFDDGWSAAIWYLKKRNTY